ncbi:Uncharacterised protein [Mycobacteroides abscessus subsp. abscessus]|nr:Uncharacterised protein [Mycobacteroides abscessus subsp. abscessus]
MHKVTPAVVSGTHVMTPAITYSTVASRFAAM